MYRIWLRSVKRYRKCIRVAVLQGPSNVCFLRVFPQITYLLTPWCRVLLEKLTGLQLVKKFPTFHGTWMFITALTSVRHLSLSWGISTNCTDCNVGFMRSSCRSVSPFTSFLFRITSTKFCPDSLPTKDNFKFQFLISEVRNKNTENSNVLSG